METTEDSMDRNLSADDDVDKENEEQQVCLFLYLKSLTTTLFYSAIAYRLITVFN